MGREARCMAQIGEWLGEGRLLLETDDLIFRGAQRLAVPLREITKATAEDGWLDIAHADGTARFDLGRAAEKWAHAIRHPPTLLDKLGVKAASRVAVVGVADAELLRQLRARTPKLTVAASAGMLDDEPYDLILYAADTPEALDALPALRARIVPAGGIWVVSPKGRPEIADVVVMAAARESGLVDVKVARFSATHTSLKLVIPKASRASGES